MSNNTYLYTISLGLSTPKGDIFNKDFVIKYISNYFMSWDIIGFKIIETIGYYKGCQESSLDFVFVNTYGLKEDDIAKICKHLAGKFEQECVLYTKQYLRYNFVGA